MQPPSSLLEKMAENCGESENEKASIFEISPKCLINIRHNWCHSAIILVRLTSLSFTLIFTSIRTYRTNICIFDALVREKERERKLKKWSGEFEEEWRLKNPQEALLMITISCNVLFIWLFNFHFPYLNTVQTGKICTITLSIFCPKRT